MYYMPNLGCCILLFFTTTLCAQEKHNNDYLAAYLLDWNKVSLEYAQCGSRLNQADRHFLLGDCPSSNAINAYYAGAALLHYTAANVLPQKYSRALKDSSINFHMSIFNKHTSLGLIYSY